VFLAVAFAILFLKASFGLSNIMFLVDALGRTPNAPLSDYSAQIQGLAHVAHAHNLPLIVAIFGAVLAVDYRLLADQPIVAASA